MGKRLILFVLAATVLAFPVRGEELPQTARTGALIRELLTKLDSTDVYAAAKEKRLAEARSKLPGNTVEERYNLNYGIAQEFANYSLDSSLFYVNRAIKIAQENGLDSLRIRAELKKTELLSVGGLYAEAREILDSMPREDISGDLLVSYYKSFSLLYHEMYSGAGEPADLKEKYRARYTVYRDSLLAVVDTSDVLYIRNMEKKEARAGNIEEARRYNSLRFSNVGTMEPGAYATLLYDRFLISYYYEGKPTGEAMDDLIKSAIIEVEICNRNIASLLRVEAFLSNINEVESAKKVSDYYYSSLRKFGSRKRLLEGGEQALKIIDRNYQLLLKRNGELLVALAFISLLLVALVFTLIVINRSRNKIASLKDDLEQSARISKNYVGVVFQLYSSYIKRLDGFRTRVHSSLRKGNVDQALELTLPSGDTAAEERKELFNNFDKAFVDIFPDFIQKVNSCLKPEEKIVPKRTEILTTELRILALIKLGIEDSTKIAEMLHCSVKTVYNLRSVLKARLAVPEEEFQKVISEL